MPQTSNAKPSAQPRIVSPSNLIALAVFVCLPICTMLGCAPTPSNRVETTEVTGTIAVDGVPAAGVQVKFEFVGQQNRSGIPATSAMTDSKGQFSATTYEVADGAPAGDYKLLFQWPTLDPVSMRFAGDRLKKKYMSEADSEYSIKVESGKPISLGLVELQSD